MTSRTFHFSDFIDAPGLFSPSNKQLIKDYVIHAIVYALLGTIGMCVALASGNVSPIWFPSGYALGLLLIRGPTFWPSIAVATFVITLLSGAPWTACIAIAFGNTLEALVAFFLIRRRHNFANGAGDIRAVTTLVVFGCFAAAPISSSIGTFALWFTGILTSHQIFDAWFIWTVGDAMGILIVTPIFIGITSGTFRRDLTRLRHRIPEAIFILGALTAALTAAAFHPIHLSFLLFPITFWAALRVGQIGVLTCVIAIVMASVTGTILGYGPLVGATMIKDLAWFDIYIGFLAIGGLLASSAASAEGLRKIEHTVRVDAENQAASLRRAQQALALNEHRLLLALRTARMSAWEWDADRHLTFSNDIETRSLQDPAVREAIERTIADIKDYKIHGAEVPIVIAGNKHWIEIRCRNVGSRGDRHMIGVCTDVTQKHLEREAQEAALRASLSRSNELAQVAEDACRARHAAEVATEAKSAFVAALSHEVRSPLGVIRGFTELLLKEQNTPNQRAWLKTIERNCDLMANLANDVLDLSKVEAGHLCIEPRAINLTDDFEEILSLMRLSAQDKGIELSVSISPSAPQIVVTDPTRLRQILLNLIGNAIKFTTHGFVKVEVTSASKSPAEEKLKIKVTDSGIGIEAAFQEKIFEPFRQANNSIERRFGGAGLGLFLARKLAEALGGTLELEWSEPAKGSCFTLMLPSLTSSDEIIGKNPKLPSPRSTALQGMNVLVVDDSPDNLLLCKCVLEGAGAKITTATNGLEAIRAAEREIYDAILMDIEMPVMDGYTALDLLKKEKLISPVIALTAHALKSEEERAMAAGFRGYLTKPIGRDRLIEVLDTIKNIRHTPGDQADFLC